MMDQTTFQELDVFTDNFKKIDSISSKLIYSNQVDDKQPYITILVITYNRPQMLRDALLSIANQKEVDYSWEVVVMDNNPQSTLPSWLPDISQNLSLRYYVNSQNLGHEGNINRGMKLALGDWVALLHDDDLLVSNYLLLITDYIDTARRWKKPLAYIKAAYQEFSGMVKADFFSYMAPAENTRFWRKSTWLGMLLKGIGPTSVNSCGSLVNRKAFISIGGYNEIFNPIGDATLGIEFMNHGYSISETATPLGFYRQGENESSKQETIYSFIRADYYLREYLYARNLISKLFGICFRNVQLYMHFEFRKNRAKKLGFVLKEDELLLPVKIKKPHVRKQLLVFMQRCFLVLYRPNIILTRWRKYNESRDFSGRIRYKNQ